MLLVAFRGLYVTCFFFFQAEDGIRDLTVTGVQTCALPISAQVAAGFSNCTAISGACAAWSAVRTGPTAALRFPSCRRIAVVAAWRVRASCEIGRASCRERGEISVVAVSLKKKKNKSTARHT